MSNRRAWRGVFRRVNHTLGRLHLELSVPPLSDPKPAASERVKKALAHLLDLRLSPDRLEKVLDRLDTLIDGPFCREVVVAAWEVEDLLCDKYGLPRRQRPHNTRGESRQPM